MKNLNLAFYINLILEKLGFETVRSERQKILGDEHHSKLKNLFSVGGLGRSSSFSTSSLSFSLVDLSSIRDLFFSSLFD